MRNSTTRGHTVAIRTSNALNANRVISVASSKAVVGSLIVGFTLQPSDRVIRGRAGQFIASYMIQEVRLARVRMSESIETLTSHGRP